MLALNNQEMSQLLRQSLNNDKRYKHSCGVAMMAKKLAQQYGVVAEQAYIAGILHDCGREYNISAMIEVASRQKIIISPYDMVAPILLHAPIGAYLAETKYGIDDHAILQAIRLHTVGGANMTKLDKIIYLADMIEPSRDYPGVDELRKIATINLNKALLTAFDRALTYVISKKQLIHPDTVTARNEIFLKDSLFDEK